MKFVNFKFIVLSFLLVPTQVLASCLETRGGFDIGSGSVKLVVATVDTCQKMIVDEILSSSRPTGAIDYLNRNNQKFGEDFKEKLKESIQDLKSTASPFHIQKWIAVATEAYRLAENGQSFIEELSKESHLPIKLIGQETEANLAILAIESAMPEIKNNKQAIVWDIGGGSQQIIAPKQIYLGKMASANFKQRVLNQLGMNDRFSPNPLGQENALKARSIAREYASNDAREAMKLAISKNDHKVYGIGGVHTGSLAGQLKLSKNDRSYNQKTLLRSLLLRSDLTDRQIGGRYADTDITNLALVLGFMEAFDIREVITVPVSLSHGLLLLNE